MPLCPTYRPQQRHRALVPEHFPQAGRHASGRTGAAGAVAESRGRRPALSAPSGVVPTKPSHNNFSEAHPFGWHEECTYSHNIAAYRTLQGIRHLQVPRGGAPPCNCRHRNNQAQEEPAARSEEKVLGMKQVMWPCRIVMRSVLQNLVWNPALFSPRLRIGARTAPTAAGVISLAAWLAVGAGYALAQQTAVCSDTPVEGQRIECTEPSTSSTDINLFPVRPSASVGLAGPAPVPLPVPRNCGC